VPDEKSSHSCWSDAAFVCTAGQVFDRAEIVNDANKPKSLTTQTMSARIKKEPPLPAAQVKQGGVKQSGQEPLDVHMMDGNTNEWKSLIAR
jgi:hypothetical protein